MKGKKGQTCGALLFLFACTWSATAAAVPTPGQVYENPVRKYAITLPADAHLRKPGGSVDIAIDSDKGYGVILQSAAAVPGMTISETAAALEAAYLGPNKPWARKIKQEVLLVAGMVAFNGYYEGRGARYRVVIIRGQINSYIFIFRTRTEFFDKLQPEFDWMLHTFRPAAGDAPAPAVLADKAKAHTMPPVTRKPAVAPAIHHFADRRLGYSVDYDTPWILERPSANAIMLSGPKGTDAFYTTVSIQNVAPPHAETAVQAASMAMDQIRAQFDRQLRDVIYERRDPYIYRKNDVLLLGEEFIATYTKTGQPYRQWSLVVPRPDGEVAYVWSYRAPVRQFDRSLPEVKAILKSWTIVKHGETAGKPKS